MATLMRILCSWTVTVAPLLAQNDTVPALQNGLEGGSGTSIPFGTNQPARVQYIYDVEDLPWTGPRVIQRVSVRADNDVPGTTTFPSKSFLFVTVLLSTTHARAETASPVYADNYGTDAMVVVDNVPITLPAQPAQAGVRAANIDFVLPVPWVYGLTPVRPGRPAPANLLVELRIHSQPTGAYRIDNVGSCSIPPVAFGALDEVLCRPTGNGALQLVPGSSMVAGGTFSWIVQGAAANAPLLLFVAASPGGLLFGHPGLPVPVPLFDPANPGLPSPVLSQLVPSIVHSAPGCWLNVVPVDALFTVANAAGTGTISIQLAADRAFLGASLYAQAVAHSLTANPMQLATSRGQQSTVCGPLGAARIYTLGSATATSGQLGLGQGAVIELH